MQHDVPACAVCADRENGGEMVVRQEVLTAEGQWASHSVIEAGTLCEHCFTWVGRVIEAVVQPAGATAATLGLPAPIGDGAPWVDHCGFCTSELGAKSVGVDLVPHRREAIGRSRYRTVGRIQQHRLCRQCATWLRTSVRDASALLGTSERAIEGAMGGWMTSATFDAVYTRLLPRDAAVVEQTIVAMGRGVQAVPPFSIGRGMQEAGAVAFVGAGPGSVSGGAADLIHRVPTEVRRRVIVVSRPDCATDAFAALQRGAGDILASPLSPQQIAGAFDRQVDGTPARHPATGLPIFGQQRAPRFNLPCHMLHVNRGREEDIQGVFLLLRRFLRGYDRIGVDPEGNLQVRVYCAREHLSIVLQRLHVVLGERTQVQAA